MLPVQGDGASSPASGARLDCPPTKRLLRVLQFFRLDAPRIAFTLGLLILSVGGNLLKPWPLAVIVDSVLEDNRSPRR